MDNGRSAVLNQTVAAPSFLTVAEGSVVVLLVDRLERGLLAGSTGIVIIVNTVERDSFAVLFCNGVLETFDTRDREGFGSPEHPEALRSMLPFKLAHARTFHEARFVAFDAANVHLEKSTVAGEVYVALLLLMKSAELSRSHISGLTLERANHVNREAMDFWEHINYSQLAT